MLIELTTKQAEYLLEVLQDHTDCESDLDRWRSEKLLGLIDVVRPQIGEQQPDLVGDAFARCRIAAVQIISGYCAPEKFNGGDLVAKTAVTDDGVTVRGILFCDGKQSNLEYLLTRDGAEVRSIKEPGHGNQAVYMDPRHGKPISPAPSMCSGSVMPGLDHG